MSKADETAQLLSLFLYSMQSYDFMAKQLAVSEGLRQFDGTSSTAASALAAFESDCAAINVRLMLQRKYFATRDAIQLKKLLQAARDAGFFEESDASDFFNRLVSTHSEPIELSLSDGTTISDQYENAADATYGSLLHADLKHTLRLIRFPQEMRLLSLAPYVLAREELLYAFRDLCLNAGFSALEENLGDKAAILRRPELSEAERSIERSPYWSNIVGRDIDETELEEFANANTLDDNLAILIAASFVRLLQKHPLDEASLRELTWEEFWIDKDDFEQSYAIMQAIENPGISSKVMHKGGEGYAQVKVLPNVLEPWMTDTPQLFINKGGCLVHLTKREGIWKIDRASL